MEDLYETEDYGGGLDEYSRAPLPLPTAGPTASAAGVTARTPLATYQSFFGVAGPQRPTVLDVDREPDTVTLHGSYSIKYGELLKQADKGRALELRFEDGIERIEFSNPKHRNFTDLPKGVNVLKGTIKATQENSLKIPLCVSVNVPAPGSLVEHGSKSTEAHAPNGYLTFKVQHKGVEEVTRVLSPEAREYLIQYPGQTAEDQDRMVTQVGNDPKTAHIQAHNPASFTVEHYNAHPEIVKSQKTIGVNGTVAFDERGRSYVDHAIATEAKAKAKAAIRGGITFCNLFTKDLVITLWPSDYNTRVDGKPVRVQGSLARVHAEQTEKEAGSRARASLILNDTTFDVSCSVTLSYITSSPNFE
jgi:hypothetical protein